MMHPNPAVAVRPLPGVGSARGVDDVVCRLPEDRFELGDLVCHNLPKSSDANIRPVAVSHDSSSRASDNREGFVARSP